MFIHSPLGKQCKVENVCFSDPLAGIFLFSVSTNPLGQAGCRVGRSQSESQTWQIIQWKYQLIGAKQRSWIYQPGHRIGPRYLITGREFSTEGSKFFLQLVVPNFLCLPFLCHSMIDFLRSGIMCWFNSLLHLIGRLVLTLFIISL